MNASPVILDISSDEEGNDRNGGQGSVLDWLNEFLDADDLPSNDGLIIDELPSGSPKGRQRPFSHGESMCHLNPKRSCPRKSAGSPDEDCVVLDCDPDKPDPVLENEFDGADDLVVVSEKGPVACRDFPHSRHLCVKFPFITTSHEKFCDLCHCYVCDIHAPCAYWGAGRSPGDHCHSSDREEKWKVARKISTPDSSTSSDPIMLNLTMWWFL